MEYKQAQTGLFDILTREMRLKKFPDRIINPLDKALQQTKKNNSAV